MDSFKDDNNPLNQTLDEYIISQKYKKRSLVDDALSTRSSNGRSSKKRKFFYTIFKNNYRPWQFQRRNSMPPCRRVHCCGLPHRIIHNCKQWNACGCDHFLDDLHSNWGTGSNYSYKSRRGNRNSIFSNRNLRRTKSYENVSSAFSFRSNTPLNNSLTKENLNVHNANNENKNVIEDPCCCPLDENIQKLIRELQNQYASTSETSALHNASNCVPKQFDTGIKLTIRIGCYYKPTVEKIIRTC